MSAAATASASPPPSSSPAPSPSTSFSSSSSSVGVGVLHSFASTRLSAGELAYIASGIAVNLRVDGRSRLDYRPLTVSTSVVAHANGSARLKFESTNVLVAVNMSMHAPDTATQRRCEGKVECQVDQSAACTIGQDERTIATRNALLTGELARIVAHSHALPLSELVIVPEQQVWHVNIDVLIIEDGGNLMDAIVMAVKAALVTTTMPPIEVVGGDGGSVEVVVNDDPFSHILLPHASQLPLLISLCKIGAEGEWILDPTRDEEECQSMRVSLAVSPSGQLCGMTKSGIGAINLTAMERIIAHATEMGVQLNHKLLDAIKAQEKQTNSTRK